MTTQSDSEYIKQEDCRSATTQLDCEYNKQQSLKLCFEYQIQHNNRFKILKKNIRPFKKL